MIPYLKESWTIFLETENLIIFFSIVAGGFSFCLLLFGLNMFRSKISDLLLPFGTESAGDHESYPIIDISNKYIYDALLMIYLSILLLLLFFHFLVPWRNQSEIHKSCNSVILLDCERKLKII